MLGMWILILVTEFENCSLWKYMQKYCQNKHSEIRFNMQLLVSTVIKTYWVNLLHLFSPTPVRQKLQISDENSTDL